MAIFIFSFVFFYVFYFFFHQVQILLFNKKREHNLFKECKCAQAWGTIVKGISEPVGTRARRSKFVLQFENSAGPAALSSAARDFATLLCACQAQPSWYQVAREGEVPNNRAFNLFVANPENTGVNSAQWIGTTG